MSALLKGKDYERLIDLIDEAFTAKMKSVHTCIPAIVEKYDAPKRRAVVKIAITVTQPSTGKQIKRPVIYNVPVMFPGTKKYTMNVILQEDDPVLLHFSERGISKFLETYKEAKSDGIGFFSINDAICVPSFGDIEDLEIPFDIEEGITIQERDGSRFILFGENRIHFQHSVEVVIGMIDSAIAISTGASQGKPVVRVNTDGAILIESTGQCTIKGGPGVGQGVRIEGDTHIEGNVTSTGTFKNNDVNIGSTHRHTTSDGVTGPPQ